MYIKPISRIILRVFHRFWLHENIRFENDMIHSFISSHVRVHTAHIYSIQYIRFFVTTL